MKINPLFDDVDFTIEDYLLRCGVENPTEYLTGQIVEPYTNYDNIDECADGVVEWIKENDIIHQICDCDSDGEISSSMLYSYLKLISPSLNIITHFHSDKSHGLSKEIFNEIKEYEPSLLLIADASTNDTDECKKLSKLNWKVQIFDHHHKEKDNPYALIVNNQISNNVKNKGLCGTGVAFKVMQAIDHKLGVSYSKQFISYVWLANVSDSVPFTHPEQYTFAKWGRKYIHKNIKPFIDEFCEGLLDNKTIAWKLTPKFNSCVRLGKLEDKQELFSVLCGEVDSSNIIDKCKKYHTQQQNQSKKMVEDVEIINNSKIVIGRLQGKTTMTGLIAGKLMSKYNKPILLGHENDGEISGSVRSPIDLKDILSDSGLTNFQAGHHRSFGFSYPSDNEQHLIDYLDSVLVDCEPLQDVLISSTIQSLPIGLFSFTEEYRHIFAKGLDLYMVHIQPFTINSSSVKILGTNKRTLKITYENVDFMLFNVSNNTKERLHIGECVDIKFECIGELGLNFYMGRTKKQVLVDKFEAEIVEEEDIWKIFD